MVCEFLNMTKLEKQITEFFNILYQFSGKLFTEDMFKLEKHDKSYSIYKFKKDNNILFCVENANPFKYFTINITILKDTLALANNSDLKVIFKKNKIIEVKSSFYFDKDKKFDLIYINENNVLQLKEVYVSDLKTFKRNLTNVENFNNYVKEKLLKKNN